jgi:coenzyme F420-reducing hydrogenase delta subunit
MEKLLLLHCAESGKKALQRMTQLGHTLPGGVRTFELPCTGRVNDVLLMETLQDGFDGVLVIGCHKDNCKYLDGNLRAEKRVNHVKQILADAGIEQKSVNMVFVAPDEGKKLAQMIKDGYGKMEVS